MALKQLTTVWGENLSDKPLQEYPRPQFVRKSYINLNGQWDYAITKTDEFPVSYDGKILVPFSPESVLSGVNRILRPNEYLFYRTTLDLPKNFVKDIILLNFGAVDCISDVYVNGKHLAHHEGGYNSFSVDITEALSGDGADELIVKVRDYTDTKYYCNGKQSTNRHGMWYTPQSGIWQTVWLESVPAQYIQGLRITPNIDDASVTVEVATNFDEPVTVKVLAGKKELMHADGKGAVKLHFPNEAFRLWSPEDPFLYNLKIISRRDMVESYFGMRKFSCKKVGKYHRLMLNNAPYFHNGLLDQGYYCDGLYTAPSDEALEFDIKAMKDLGFNMLRKHIKVEPMRWYYHCDRLGMLVWQDMPSGGSKQHKWITLIAPNIGINGIKDNRYARFSRSSEQGRESFVSEYTEMLDQLYNCVSIAMWVPFNEAWGQFDANNIAQLTKDIDPTRTVDHASGWHDQGGGDINSMHVYFKKVRLKKDGKRAVCLTEFGGYSYKDMQHSFNPDHTYSYKKFDTIEQFNDGVYRLYERDVIRWIDKGLSATVYTQVTDVEDEVNGLYTYDRKVLKIDPNMIREINKKVKL